MLTFLMLLVCIIATVTSDYFGEPPTYLVALLGTSAGAFFTAIGSDQKKREIEDRDHNREIAARAERKADAVEHRVDESDLRADAAEDRDHDEGGGGNR